MARVSSGPAVVRQSPGPATQQSLTTSDAEGVVGAGCCAAAEDLDGRLAISSSSTGDDDVEGTEVSELDDDAPEKEATDRDTHR